MATTQFHEAVDELMELFEPYAAVGRQRIKRAYAKVYRRILRRYPWRELLTDWVTFTWTSGRVYDPITQATITDWWGRPAVMRGDSDTEIWKQIDEVDMARQQGWYDGASASATSTAYTHRNGQRVFAISARKWQINVVGDLTNETVNVRHFADPGDLEAETDELVVEDDYETFKAKAAVEIWHQLPEGMTGNLPILLREMNAAADTALMEMVSAMNDEAGVELDIAPDGLLIEAAAQQAWERGGAGTTRYGMTNYGDDPI